MVEQQITALDRVFHALSDGTRRAMIAHLAGGERNISELAVPFSMSFAGASKHVKVLEQAGIVRRRRSGRMHYCSLEPQQLAHADAWLRHYTKFWTERLDALDAMLSAEGETGAHTKGS